MMGRALWILGCLATMGLVATAVVGYLMEAAGGLDWHLLMGLLSSLLVLFSHCWIMFYLIGTGKAIKLAVEEHGLDPALSEATKDFKNRSYPWLLLAMGAVMITFIVGGGVATRVIAPWIHAVLFFASLAIQVWALGIEGQVLIANERLMQQAARLIPEKEVI